MLACEARLVCGLSRSRSVRWMDDALAGPRCTAQAPVWLPDDTTGNAAHDAALAVEHHALKQDHNGTFGARW